MVFESDYVSLKHTLKLLKLQVIDSLPYVFDFIDKTNDPEDLFYQLKDILTFKHDPKGVEFLQSMQTLINKNDGHGDCDCFTITALACLYSCGFEPLYVALTGKSELQPTHIYCEVYDPVKQKICAFDLTNPLYNMQRPYKYKQRLLFTL